MRVRRLLVTAVAALALAPVAARADPQQASKNAADESVSAPASPEGGDGDLAKAVQNPVSDMISVPFQNNIDYGIGPHDRVRNTLNIQPVVPMPLGGGLNLVSRFIIPIVYQPDVAQTGGGSSGLGDINPTFYVSPAKPGKVIWGLGPSFLLNTATQRATGTGKWSAGASAVVLMQPGSWTLGALATNVWSFAGAADRDDVNQLSLQYFVNYNITKAVFLTSSPIITANWKAPSGERWTVPFGLGLGAIFKVGKQAMNGQVAAYYNAITPDTLPAADWTLRVQLAFLFPRRKS
jgi:hypothetical protein